MKNQRLSDVASVSTTVEERREEDEEKDRGGPRHINDTTDHRPSAEAVSHESIRPDPSFSLPPGYSVKRNDLEQVQGETRGWAIS